MRDPHHSIGLIASPEETPDNLWDQIEIRLNQTSQIRPDLPRNLFSNAVTGALVATTTLFAAPYFNPAPSKDQAHARLTHDGQEYMLVAADRANQRPFLFLSPDQLQPPKGKSLEVWFVSDESATPLSLGLAAREGATSAHIVPDQDAGTIAISIEESGGSTSGNPEGPVIVTAPVELFF